MATNMKNAVFELWRSKGCFNWL